MATRTVVVSANDLSKAFELVEDLRRGGRADEAEIVLKLIAQAELASQDSAFTEDDLTPEDIAALERSEADIAAGRAVPHEVVVQGSAAVEAYLRKRERGEADPEVAAALEAYRWKGQ